MAERWTNQTEVLEHPKSNLTSDLAFMRVCLHLKYWDLFICCTINQEYQIDYEQAKIDISINLRVNRKMHALYKK